MIDEFDDWWLIEHEPHNEGTPVLEYSESEDACSYEVMVNPIED